MEKKEYLTIDGIPVAIEGEKNLLELIRKIGIKLPTFCYHSELSIYGACRMCMVENQWGGMEAACSTPPPWRSNSISRWASPDWASLLMAARFCSSAWAGPL